MHDSNGTELKVGDRVLIEAVITKLTDGEDYCNCCVTVIKPRRPPGSGSDTAYLNTASVTLVE